MRVFCNLMEFNSCELQELNIFHYFSKKDHVRNALLMLVDNCTLCNEFLFNNIGNNVWVKQSFSTHMAWHLGFAHHYKWAIFWNILLVNLNFLEEVKGFPNTMCHWKHAAREQVGPVWLILEKQSSHVWNCVCLASHRFL